MQIVHHLMSCVTKPLPWTIQYCDLSSVSVAFTPQHPLVGSSYKQGRARVTLGQQNRVFGQVRQISILDAAPTPPYQTVILEQVKLLLPLGEILVTHQYSLALKYPKHFSLG